MRTCSVQPLTMTSFIGGPGARLRVLRLLSKTAAEICSTFTNASDIEEIYAFRYGIYIQELQKDLPWADHERRLLPDPYDCGATHIAVRRRGDRVVGCVRLHFGRDIPSDFLEAMQVTDFVRRDSQRCCYASKFMVERELRGHGVALLMIRAMIDFGISAGVEYALFHCNPKLVRLYEKLGFRLFGKSFEMAHVGMQIPMIFILGDANHCEKVGSPLANLAARVHMSEDRLAFLRKTFVGS